MIYTDQQLIEKIRKMIIDFEDEVVEFKEARTNYSFKDIITYDDLADFSDELKESVAIILDRNKGNRLV